MKNILAVATLAAIVSAVAVGGAAAGLNLVQDGSFATTTTDFFDGMGNNAYWLNDGYHGDTLHGVSNCESSQCFFNYTPSNWSAQPTPNFAYSDAGSSYQTYTFYQPISGLVSGEKYTLTFLAAFANESPGTSGNSASWEANLGGSATFSSGLFSGWSGGQTADAPDISIPCCGAGDGYGWVTQSVTFIYSAADPTNYLNFVSLGVGAPPFALITDISLTSGVPEASTWAMMIAGFAGLGAAAFVRRRRAIAAAI